MWYRQAQFNKQAASIGMYVESIAKNMARMFMRELRKEFLSHKNNYVSFYMLIDMNTAIDMMQVEDRKKSHMLKKYEKIIWHMLIKNTVTNDKEPQKCGFLFLREKEEA